MDESKSETGERLRYFRELKGLSQRKLGIMSNLRPSESTGQSLIKNMELGRKEVKKDDLEKLINAMGVSEEEFFSTKLPRKRMALPEVEPEFLDYFPEMPQYIDMYNLAVEADDKNMQRSVMKNLATKLLERADELRDEINDSQKITTTKD